MRHVLLTRFNLPSPGKEAALRAKSGWLARRFQLFRDYCLPSVAGQLHADCVWIVFFDLAKKAEVQSEVRECRKVVEFVPYYTDWFDSSGWRLAIESVLGACSGPLLTTRLDNDDAICQGFLRHVHRVACEYREASVPLCFNPTEGFVHSGAKLYRMRHRSNAFLSVLEDSGCALTAMSYDHMSIASHMKVVQMKGSPGWIQYVHGGNVSNRVRGWRVSPARCEGLPSAIKNGLGRASSVQIWGDNIMCSGPRWLRDRAIGAAKLARRVVIENPFMLGASRES